MSKKLIIIITCFSLLIPVLSQAVVESPKLAVPIPGLIFTTGSGGAGSKSFESNWIASYIIALYRYGLAIIGIIAIVSIAIGGLLWVMSAGNASKISQAQGWIKDALLGVGLLLGSFLILSTINKDLVIFKSLNLKYIEHEDLPNATDYSPTYSELKKNKNNLQDLGEKGIVVVTVNTVNGSKTIYMHSSVSQDLQSIMNELNTLGFPVQTLADYRPNSNFCHGRGLAIDINPAQNYCVDCYSNKGSKVGSLFQPGSNPLSVTEEVVNVFKKHGWCWGGDWGNFKDYMHFSKNCSANECAQKGRYNWSLSPQQNQQRLGITFP